MRDLKAEDVMNNEVIAVSEHLSLREVATLLVSNEITGAPVVDRNGKLVGVVSVTDIARSASTGGETAVSRADRHFFVRGWEEDYDIEELRSLHIEEDEVTARDIMTPTVFTVEKSAPVHKVVKSMLDGHLHRVIVTSEQKVVGIVSTSDLLRLLLDES